MRMFLNNMLFSAASITLTAGLVAYADPAIASVAPQATAQARVAYADLDLSSDAGRATLDRRIRSAATQVCTTGATSDWFESAPCRKQAIADAHRAIGARTADAAAPAVQVATR